MKTFVPKTEDINRKWYVVDAEGLVLGRLASQVANILRGKNKPIYTPNVDTGDYVIIVNADKVVLTGKKLDQKFEIWHTGWIGHLKKVSYRELMEKRPEHAMFLAVNGMLPNNHIGRTSMKRLRVYAGAEHKNAAQKPELWTL